MKTIYLIAFFLFLLSCNKEKRFSNRLMKKEQWKITELTIDGAQSELNGVWNVSPDINIYDSIPVTKWTFGSQDSYFLWQFQENGKLFELNYQQQCEECEGENLDSLDIFTFAISGKYSVEKHGLNKMIFESSSTKKFPGKNVVINLQRVK